MIHSALAPAHCCASWFALIRPDWMMIEEVRPIGPKLVTQIVEVVFHLLLKIRTHDMDQSFATAIQDNFHWLHCTGCWFVAHPLNFRRESSFATRIGGCIILAELFDVIGLGVCAQCALVASSETKIGTEIGLSQWWFIFGFGCQFSLRFSGSLVCGLCDGRCVYHVMWLQAAGVFIGSTHIPVYWVRGWGCDLSSPHLFASAGRIWTRQCTDDDGIWLSPLCVFDKDLRVASNLPLVKQSVDERHWNLAGWFVSAHLKGIGNGWPR